MAIIQAYKCKECGKETPANEMPGCMEYHEFDGDITKDWNPICPNCDAEGDDYFETIEEDEAL